MCRGGSISCLLAAAAISLFACVDADNATPSYSSPALAPKGGTTASVTPTGVAGTLGTQTTTPVATTPVTTTPSTLPTTPAGAAGAAGMIAAGAGGSSSPATGGAGGSAGAGGAKAGSGGAGGAAGSAAAGAGGTGGSGGAATGPKFSDVYPILMGKCVACHGTAPGRGGLVLGADANAAYTALTSGMSATGMCMGMKFVTSSQPDMSVVVMAVKGSGCRNGRPMPPAGAKLADTDVQKISDWIKAGAMK